MNKRFSETAMLADLSTGHWRARKHDKRVDADVASRNNTTEKAGRYNKNLFPFEAPTYEALTSAMARARLYHNEQTLPWSEDGERILLSANHFDYNAGMRTRRRETENAWLEFVDDLPRLKEQSRLVTNGLFAEADWPDPVKLQRSFKFKLELFPFPDVQDWRADISEIELRGLKEQTEESVQARIAEAMKDPYRRLFEAVKKMADTLSGDGEGFRESLVDNIKRQVALIPKLNLVGDERLTDLGEEIIAALTPFHVDSLRPKGHVRITVAARAEELAADLKCYMGEAA